MATPATTATAGRRRTAAPRVAPELAAYKTRFNEYLVLLGLPLVDNLTPADVASPGDIESIMCSWADHMSTHPPRYLTNPNKLLKADGVGNGFGLIKEYLKDKFGRHDDWSDETWFTLAKGALVKKLDKDGIRGVSGVDEVPGKIGLVRLNPDASVAEGHDGISTSPFADEIPDLVTVNRMLLKGSLGDIHQRRLALNLTYNADGRSGEVKYLNYQSMLSDPVGRCLSADWKDLKNSSVRPVTYCTDYNQWETCVFDSLGDHWSVDGGLSRQCNSSGQIGFLSSFVVPMCQSRTDAWTSKMLTDTLRQYMPPSIKDSVSGRSLRYGGTTHLHEDPVVNHPELTARSGHAPSDNSRHYILSSRAMQYVPMRSLAGYPSPRKPNRPPRLMSTGASADHLALMERFADELYPSTMPHFKAGGRLRQLVREVLATNLMNFSSKLSFLGVGGPAVRRMMLVADGLGISLGQLKEWSKKVADDFNAINKPYSSAEEELAVVVAENNRLVIELRKEVADLKAAAATNTSTVLQLETQLQEANSRLLNVSPPSTPQRNPTAQPPAPDAGGGRRRRQESPPRSPVRSVRRRADDNSGIVRSTISAIAASPAAIAQRIVGRSAPPPPAPNFHPPAIMNQSSTVSAGGGSKTYKRWPNMSEIVIELARGGQLKSGTAYENIPPPLAILPRQLDRNERTKYNYAMRVVSAAVKEDQEAVFRAKDVDNAALVAKGKALDLEVRRWISNKTGKDLKKVTAKVLGVGANAQQLPDSAWPRPTGGLFGGLLFSRNN